jgi:pimeloyl-ACP methyl ester carboxylesterase
MVCVHGFTDTCRTWDLVLPALSRRHQVIAPTLPGHAGGVPLDGELDDETLFDAVVRAMDEAGFDTAHVVGNSLGGYVALRLAQRGRAKSVVALAPAGGWAAGDASFRETMEYFRTAHELVQAAAPHADQMVATSDGRRRATAFTTTNFEHIPHELLAHQIRGAAACSGFEALLEHGLTAEWSIDPELIDCPVRFVWGTADRLLPWPAAASRYRTEWLPQADWIELEGVGHCPQLDVPLETGQLILGFTDP